jgi:hypothetical protein
MPRAARDFTPVAAASDSEMEGRSPPGAAYSESDDEGSGMSVGKILVGLAVAFALVMGASCLASAYRGRAAADAILSGYAVAVSGELNPDKMQDAYDAEMAERLMDRAGQGDSLGNGEVLMSIEEIVEKAKSGELAFQQRMQDEIATSSGNTTTMPLYTEEPTPYPTQSKEEIEHVINELIMTKLNEFMSVQQTNLNIALPGMIGPQVRKAKFPSTNKQKIDNIYGLESMYIDTMECYSVKSDLDTGSALAYVRIHATTDPLTVKLRARPGNSGSFYHITMRVYGFYISAYPVATIDFQKQALTALKVGWIQTGCERLDGTCYSKDNPSQRDGLCTAILNKQLRKEKAGMFRQLSSAMSRQAQSFANKIVPFKLPAPPSPAPTPPPTNVTKETARRLIEL